MTAVATLPYTERSESGVKRLLVIFALSGAAGLIYEVVWFQLLRLTIGANSQSLGVLLACFMGGLFGGSLLYARFAPRRWNPLITYAVLEILIGAIGLIMPWLIGQVRLFYLDHAADPQNAMLWRSLFAAVLLAPPTLLMGATLPALARYVESDERQASWIGTLYSSNIIGAVVGTLGSALFLMPAVGVSNANLVAVGLNALCAVLAVLLRGNYRPASERAAPDVSLEGTLPIALAFGLNGMASLSFEVLWSRLLGLVFGATAYAFALVLGIFLLGLGLGGVAGSALGQRLKEPRRAFGLLQLLIAASVSGTSLLAVAVATWMVPLDMKNSDNPALLTMTNLARAVLVCFPGAFLWGMSFPLALVSLGRNLGDAARPVARLYAFNTVGCVLGSLATSFLLIPIYGTTNATTRLMILPLAAAAILMLPRSVPGIVGAIIAVSAFGVTYLTPLPSQAGDAVMELLAEIAKPGGIPTVVYPIVLLGVAGVLAARLRGGWTVGLAVLGLGLSLATKVPPHLYMLGRSYGLPIHTATRQSSEILYFSEGVMEPVVVYRNPRGHVLISINSKVQASSVPEDMQVQRVLGHVPVLLSRDPSKVLVVGMGAGVTAGACSIHDEVKELTIAELEPKVPEGTRKFGQQNFNVLDNPKTRVVFDDGRHYISTRQEKYGVITSDPIDPYLAGTAALYSVEYYKAARDKLIEGGSFCQWLGMGGMDAAGMKSLIAAFAEVFPEGSIWITPVDVVFIGTKGPCVIDMPRLRDYLANNPRVLESLKEVWIDSAEALVGHCLAPVATMKEWLSDAQVNRDSNLIIQYTSWQAFYRLFDQDQHSMQRLMLNQRKFDPAMFKLAADEELDGFQFMQGRFFEKFSDFVALREKESRERKRK